MGRRDQGFYPNAKFFQNGGYKTKRIIKYFLKEKKNEYICVKLVIILVFFNEKVFFIGFLSKI